MSSQSTSRTALAELVEDYLSDCRARRLSKNTVENAYGYPLRRILLPFCEAQGIEDLGRLDQRALNRLANKLQEEGGPRGPLSEFSIHAYMRSTNHFLTWAMGDGQEVNGKAKLPKLPERVIDTLGSTEIQAMEDAASNIRDELIVRVLADTGIRVGELVKLRVSDVQADGGRYQLRVRGKAGSKGERERLVVLERKLYRRLREYIDHKRPKGADGERVFYSVKKRAGGGYEPLTESGVQQLVRVLADRVGIKKRVHPHTFRHSFITESLKRGVQSSLLARYVGHTTTRMIDTVYGHVTSEDAHAAILDMLRKRSSDEQEA